MSIDANTVYELLLTFPFERQRAINSEELLRDNSALKQADLRSALAVLETEGKVKLIPSPRGNLLSIYSGRQDCYKMHYQIEVFARKDRQGFKARIDIRHTVTPATRGSYLNDFPPEWSCSPNDTYASAEEAFGAGFAVAKRAVDEYLV